jgi:hypothetical protein
VGRCARGEAGAPPDRLSLGAQPVDSLKARVPVPTHVQDQTVGLVDVPLIGGPADGRDADVPIDDEGNPPAALDQGWLWTAFGSELLDADVDGVYELETVAGAGPPWLYRWRAASPAR